MAIWHGNSAKGTVSCGVSPAFTWVFIMSVFVVEQVSINVNFPSSNFYLFPGQPDDTLYEIFGQLKKTVMLEVFLDCCHSGTGLRDIGLERPPELGPENPTASRFLPPPMDIVCRSEGDEEDLKETRRLFRKKNNPSNQVLWSGCMAHQTSADAYIKGDYNGAFTYYFCDHMRKSSARLSRRRLLKRIRNSLRHNQYSQIPQLESAATVRKIRALTAKEKA